MKKLLLSIIGLLFFISVTMAEQTPSDTIEPLQPEGEQKLYWMSMPVICGTQENVEEYLKTFNFIMANMSVGRAGAKEDGEIVYYVTYWISEDFTQSIAVVTNMGATESCMMYKSFGLKWTEPPNLGTNL